MNKAAILSKIESSGVSISEIARRCGVTRATIYSWIDSGETFNHNKILTVLPSDNGELERLKQTNKILLEKINQLEEENARLRDQSEKDLVVDARESLGKQKKMK